MPSTDWLVFAMVLIFLAFLLVKARVDLLRLGPEYRAARRAVAEAKGRAWRARRDPSQKAAAWREASQIALEQLERPSLAASYALRALRADGDDVSAIALLVQALQDAGRLRALERLLWRRVNRQAGPGRERAYEALVQLYEGPLKHRAKAKALRTLREQAG